jgi:hypothetical protein
LEREKKQVTEEQLKEITDRLDTIKDVLSDILGNQNRNALSINAAIAEEVRQMTKSLVDALKKR